MIIKIDDPNKCPLRSQTESGGKCNITHGCCEEYDASYPCICPLLDDEVTIKRIANEKGKQV